MNNKKIPVDGFIRGSEGVILNIDNNALQAYKSQKARFNEIQNMKEQVGEIQNIKSEIKEIKEMLSMILENFKK